MAQFNDGDTNSSIRGLLNSTGLRKNNFAGGSTPTISNDSSQGYEIGSLWLDRVANKLYFATTVDANTATWTEIGKPYNDTDVQIYLDAKGYSNVDNDAQTLSWDEGTSLLTISGGNSVTVTGLYTDSNVQNYLTVNNYSNVDPDPQTLSWQQNTFQLTISDGNTIALTGVGSGNFGSLATQTINVAGDFLPFYGAGNSVITSVSDFVDAIAGSGITALNGVMSVVDLDNQTITIAMCKRRSRLMRSPISHV